MTILRTPDERFANLPGFPYEPHYVTLASGLRMHYVDHGRGDPVFCLHGEPTWSYLYRKMIPRLAEANRVVAPDFIGFGRSDKLPEKSDYSFAMHFDALTQFVEALDLQRITLVCQDWGGLLGLPLATSVPSRFARLVVMNTGLPTGEWAPTPAGEATKQAFLAWRRVAERTTDMDMARVLQGATVTELPPDVLAAYAAPFPDASYKAGPHQFPLLVPIDPSMAAAEPIRACKKALTEWRKPALAMFSDSDPITAGGDRMFRKLIPTAAEEPEITIRGAGHFLQEDKGEELADHIAEFIARRPIV